MLDSGFSARETVLRFERHDRSPDKLSAILITHEHGDHCRGVASCARRFGVPVWMTAGTFAALKGQFDADADIRLINPHESFAIGDIEVQPFPVPHDAREPCQFVFTDGDMRFGFPAHGLPRRRELLTHPIHRHRQAGQLIMSIKNEVA